jgi:hypothetical protein
LTVSTCKHCGGALSEFENVSRFIEDIDIAALINKALKTVIKLTVERGRCQRCGKWTSAADLRGQTCTLGPNVTLVIPYLITVLDQTYEQVKTTLRDFFGLTISDAEITRMLAKKGQEWRPEYHRLDADIRGQPGNHLDETTWNIQAYAKHCYAWIKAGTKNANVLFRLALSRGGQHAKELLGDYTGVRVTDGYSAYAKSCPERTSSAGHTSFEKPENWHSWTHCPTTSTFTVNSGMVNCASYTRRWKTAEQSGSMNISGGGTQTGFSSRCVICASRTRSIRTNSRT